MTDTTATAIASRENFDYEAQHKRILEIEHERWKRELVTKLLVTRMNAREGALSGFEATDLVRTAIEVAEQVMKDAE